MLRSLLLATNNKGKVREYLTLLPALKYKILTMADAGIKTVVDETGATMEENARLKAEALAQESGLLCLADDSGLEVDALNGAPGVLSARYAGPNVTDRQRNQYLLDKLRDVPAARRAARFRCIIALAEPAGRTQLFEGVCPGIITFEPSGEQGFGYDPIFFLPEFNRTMAELRIDEKNRISHRGMAAYKARAALEELAR